MYRRLYLLLVLVRLYFALQFSYIHPDEHFQGPEIVAGEIFNWPSYQTWEFQSSHPIRSVFPLALVYGFPLTILKWIWHGLGRGEVPSLVAFYTLRVLMFVLSFTLEDWALHELIASSRDRAFAIILVASSYVTCTFQTHTFSNSIETLLVLWCLALIRRIRAARESTLARACAALSALAVLGVFNRITFPAFLLVPGVQLLPNLIERPLRIAVILLVAAAVTILGIAIDTEFYTASSTSLITTTTNPIFTPWNNLRYNLNTSNLAEHGLHPFWQHFLANLPQLLGPAWLLLFISSRSSSLFWSGLSGIAILSCFQHQEPRFLLPAVPLLLASIRRPLHFPRVWLTLWIVFNVFAGVLFGIFHQGGVIPAQIWVAEHGANATQVLWWKTYSPPRWLLAGKNHDIATVDLMGMRGEEMIANVTRAAGCDGIGRQTLLAAPASAVFLDEYVGEESRSDGPVRLQELWRYARHVGLDDLDFGDDGIWSTLARVVGRRGVVVYQVHKRC